jgi:hypothetical protein
MSRSQIQSIIALVVGISGVVAAQYADPIHKFLDSNPLIGMIMAGVIIVWNNLSSPVHKP